MLKLIKYYNDAICLLLLFLIINVFILRKFDYEEN